MKLFAFSWVWHLLKPIERMNRINNILAIAIFFLFTSFSVGATNIAELKALCEPGKSIKLTHSFVIEGVVVSDYRSKNVENNPNITYAKVDLEVNDATVYLQEPDGRAGVRLRFAERSDNEMFRFDRVSIDLKGHTIIHHSDPDCVTVEDIVFTDVVKYEHGTQQGVTIKRKYIDELVDADLYTMVTLNDVEMVFKDGTYADIYEGYAQYVPGYPYNGDYLPNLRMDGWASLMRDSRGNSIYMLINTSCAWRRNGKGVFKGMGPVTGIIVHTPLRRYGGEMGRYSLRPVEYGDIIDSKKTKSPWKCLTGWRIDDSIGQALVFETLGEQTGVLKNGKKGDRVINDIGSTKGFLWTDSDSFVHIGSDLNFVDATLRGTQKNGAIMFKGPTKGWFDFDRKGKPVQAKSFYIQFSTKKAKGSLLQFSFAWIAGDTDAEHNYNYPGQWKVEYTFDDPSGWRMADLSTLNWTPVVDNATQMDMICLRSHPWWDAKLKGNNGLKRTGYDCGLGMQQHSFNLPADALGRDCVVIRITPASFNLSAIRSNPTKDVLNPAGVPTPDMRNVTWIRFGNISLDYK